MSKNMPVRPKLELWQVMDFKGKYDIKDIAEFFEHGEFHQEWRVVDAIKHYLLSPEQKKWLYKQDLSVEDILNGRYDYKFEKQIIKILKSWNKILGVKHFSED